MESQAILGEKSDGKFLPLGNPVRRSLAMPRPIVTHNDSQALDGSRTIVLVGAV